MTEVTQLTEVKRKPQTLSLVDSLRDLAGKNAAFNAIAHTWAMRERTRHQVTVHALDLAMTKEGFSFTREDYRSVLAKLAAMKLGTLQRDSKGTITGLKGVNYTLQSLGLASLSKKNSLRRSTVKTPFTSLQIPKENIKEKAVIVDTVLKKPIKETTLTIKIGHKTFNFDLFPESKVKELIDTVDKVYQDKALKA